MGEYGANAVLLGVCAIGGALVTVAPGLLWLAGLPLLLLVAITPTGRLCIFVFGALATLGREGNVSTEELGMIVLATAIASVSLVRVLSATPDERNYVRRYLKSAGLFAIVALSGIFVGLFRGAPTLDALRDGAGYILLSQGILVGIDAGLSATRKSLTRILWLAVGLSALSVFFGTLVRRRALDAPVAVLPLGAQSLVMLGVAAGVALMFVDRRIVLGPAAIALLMGSVVLGGTRSGVFLLAALGGATAARATNRLRIPYALAGVTAVGGVVVALTLVLIPRIADADVLASRLASLGTIWHRGLSADPSALERRELYLQAYAHFERSPLLGEGLGRVLSEKEGGGYYLDSPLLYLAKFGVAGSLLLLAGLWYLLGATGEAGSETPHVRVLKRGFGLAVIALVPFTAILEEKGFALAATILTALAVQSRLPVFQDTNVNRHG